MNETTNTVNYFEIGTPDPETARRFYGELFGWEFGPAGPTGYGMVNGNAGGLWDTSGIGSGTWAVFYVEVADVHASVEAALVRGAQTVLPVTDNGVILFVHLADPAGNRFGMWQRKTGD